MEADWEQLKAVRSNQSRANEISSQILDHLAEVNPELEEEHAKLLFSSLRSPELVCRTLRQLLHSASCFGPLFRRDPDTLEDLAKAIASLGPLPQDVASVLTEIAGRDAQSAPSLRTRYLLFEKLLQFCEAAPSCADVSSVLRIAQAASESFLLLVASEPASAGLDKQDQTSSSGFVVGNFLQARSSQRASKLGIAIEGCVLTAMSFPGDEDRFAPVVEAASKFEPAQLKCFVKGLEQALKHPAPTSTGIIALIAATQRAAAAAFTAVCKDIENSVLSRMDDALSQEGYTGLESIFPAKEQQESTIFSATERDSGIKWRCIVRDATEYDSDRKDLAAPLVKRMREQMSSELKDAVLERMLPSLAPRLKKIRVRFLEEVFRTGTIFVQFNGNVQEERARDLLSLAKQLGVAVNAEVKQVVGGLVLDAAKKRVGEIKGGRSRSRTVDNFLKGDPRTWPELQDLLAEHSDGGVDQLAEMKIEDLRQVFQSAHIDALIAAAQTAAADAVSAVRKDIEERVLAKLDDALGQEGYAGLEGLSICSTKAQQDSESALRCAVRGATKDDRTVLHSLVRQLVLQEGVKLSAEQEEIVIQRILPEVETRFKKIRVRFLEEIFGAETETSFDKRVYEDRAMELHGLYQQLGVPVKAEIRDVVDGLVFSVAKRRLEETESSEADNRVLDKGDPRTWPALQDLLAEHSDGGVLAFMHSSEKTLETLIDSPKGGFSSDSALRKAKAAVQTRLKEFGVPTGVISKVTSSKERVSVWFVKRERDHQWIEHLRRRCQRWDRLLQKREGLQHLIQLTQHASAVFADRPAAPSAAIDASEPPSIPDDAGPATSQDPAAASSRKRTASASGIDDAGTDSAGDASAQTGCESQKGGGVTASAPEVRVAAPAIGAEDAASGAKRPRLAPESDC